MRSPAIWHKAHIYLREGGSIPIIRDLREVAGLEALMLGLFTNEDNLHAPDESFNLQIMDRAIESFESFFLKLGEEGIKISAFSNDKSSTAIKFSLLAISIGYCRFITN